MRPAPGALAIRPEKTPERDESSPQDRYAPATTCFGCGPVNAEGLRIKSFVCGDEVVAE